MKRVNAIEIEDNLKDKFIVKGGVLDKSYPIKVGFVFDELVAELPISFSINCKTQRIEIRDDSTMIMSINPNGYILYNDFIVAEVYSIKDYEMWIIEMDEEIGSTNKTI